MYFATILSLCFVGAILGECPSDQVEYECKPCTQQCKGSTIYCNKKCEAGCACPVNKVTDAEGKCIDPAACPLQCFKINEVYYAFPKCTPQCHQTCDSFSNDGPKPQACTDQCVSDQCACPEGYVKDNTGNCLTQEQCKELKNGCRNGEFFYDLASSGGCAPCERHCDNYYKANVACVLSCVTNICRCAPGYVRTSDPSVLGCIPVEQCPVNKDCGKNAMLPWDGNCAPCERTCDNFYKKNVPCSKICKRQQCVCKDGFVRNAQNECVAISECPAPTCGKGEKFYGPNECRPCEDGCPNMPVIPGGIYCTKDCVSNVCSCSNGFKRDSDNSCVDVCPAS